jgi:hypothetical protein
MRIDTDTPFWVVADPIGDSATTDDILFETTLRGLERQFQGGLLCDSNPVIFMERGEAEGHAHRRLEAWERYREEAKATEARHLEAMKRYRAEIEGLP